MTLEWGTIVKPTADAVARTRFSETSRLRVRRSRSRRYRWCAACYAAQLEREGYDPETLPHRGTQQRISRESMFTVEAGGLYAASSERASYLCPDHLEPA